MSKEVRDKQTIIRLIIERTCVQSVYAQDNYALDSRQRYYQIELRSAISTHVRSIINWIIVLQAVGWQLGPFSVAHRKPRMPV